MRSNQIALAGLLVTCMLSGCYIVPGPHGEGVSIVPALPAVLVLDTEPYYYQGGYHYYYHDNAWFYARSRSGPWVALPRDRYPHETRYRQNSGHRDEGRHSGY